MTDDPKVRELRIVCLEQEATDAGFIHFDPQAIPIAALACDGKESLTVAEADLEQARRAMAEHTIEIERRGSEVDTEARPQPFPCARLRGRDAPATAHETAHAPPLSLRFRGRGAAHGVSISHAQGVAHLSPTSRRDIRPTCAHLRPAAPACSAR